VLCARGTLEEISLGEKPLRKRVYRRVAGDRLIRAADVVLFDSERECSESAAALGDTPGLAIPSGFEAAAPRPRDGAGLRRRLGLPDATLLAGLAGRVHPRKGFDTILGALAHCPERVHLVAFGPDHEGHSERFLELARTLGVARRFHPLGYLAGEALQDAYASIDLLVLPSFGESFGNVVIEALIQGTEVMVSDRVGLAEYVARNDLGVVVRGTRPEEWSSAIEVWRERHAGFDRERARRTVVDEFDLERCGRRLLDALATRLSPRRPGSRAAPRTARPGEPAGR